MNLSEPVRAYLYRILLALAALAVIYGFATETEIAGWVGLGSPGTGWLTRSSPSRWATAPQKWPLLRASSVRAPVRWLAK